MSSQPQKSWEHQLSESVRIEPSGQFYRTIDEALEKNPTAKTICIPTGFLVVELATKFIRFFQSSNDVIEWLNGSTSELQPRTRISPLFRFEVKTISPKTKKEKLFHVYQAPFVRASIRAFKEGTLAPSEDTIQKQMKVGKSWPLFPRKLHVICEKGEKCDKIAMGVTENSAQYELEKISVQDPDEFRRCVINAYFDVNSLPFGVEEEEVEDTPMSIEAYAAAHPRLFTTSK